MNAVHCRPTRPLVRYILLPLAACILFLFAFSFVGFLEAVFPNKLVSSITPADLGLAYEAVAFTTEDGIELKGWFIPRQDQGQSRQDSTGTNTIILLHGYPADKGDVLPTFAGLADEYRLFLFDFRGLGESEGRSTTVGAREVNDLRAALRFLETRGVGAVGVWGFSMGAAVALMTAPDAPAIKAVVADSSYARLALMAPELYRIPLLKHPLGLLTGLWAKLVLNVNIEDAAPEQDAARLEIPVLLIHSTNDAAIPFSHALRIKEALRRNPRAEFWFEPDRAHGELRSDYLLRIQSFFNASF